VAETAQIQFWNKCGVKLHSRNAKISRLWA
jgi:hypothetical protein